MAACLQKDEQWIKEQISIFNAVAKNYQPQTKTNNVWLLLLANFAGTALLIIMGDGVVANVVLNKTKGQNSGWIVITFGWAMAVFLGVYTSLKLGGSGHLNPAVTIAMAAFNGFDSSLVAAYIGAQFAGAIAGALQ